MKMIFAVAIFAALFSTPAEARKTTHALASECNVSMPCEGGFYSERAKKFINIPFGSPRQSYVARQESVVSHPPGFLWMRS
jgi:hypothetical protein